MGGGLGMVIGGRVENMGYYGVNWRSNSTVEHIWER